MFSDNVLSFSRQTFVLSACLFSSFSGGLMLAFPSALNPAIMSPNSTDIRATSDQASWIAMSNGLAGMLGFCILPPIMQYFGRRTVQIFLNILAMTGWIIFVFASSVTDLFAARMMQGLKIGGFIINVITTSEFAHPTRRGYFHTLKKVFSTIGILTCHAMTMRFTWRHIAMLGVVANCLAILVALFWPETPPYLAMKGRFEECEKSYLWLNGKSSKGCRELTTMISTHMERLSTKEERKKQLRVLRFLKKFLDNDFKKAILIVQLVVLIIEATGMHYFSAYILQIMSELVEDKSAAVYYSLGSDAIIVITLFLSCFVIRLFNRRTLLFTFGSLSSTMLLLMSLLVFLKTRHNYLSASEWVIPVTTILHSFFVYLGLVPVCFSLIGEIFSAEHRVIGITISGLSVTLIYSASIKLIPIIMETIGLEFVYLIFGLTMAVSLMGLFFILPETKDKTLQDIENDMKGIKCSVVEMTPILPKNM